MYWFKYIFFTDGLKKKKKKKNSGYFYSHGDFGGTLNENAFTGPFTCLTVKENPICFSGYQDPLVNTNSIQAHIDILLLLTKDL